MARDIFGCSAPKWRLLPIHASVSQDILVRLAKRMTWGEMKMLARRMRWHSDRIVEVVDVVDGELHSCHLRGTHATSHHACGLQWKVTYVAAP